MAEFRAIDLVKLWATVSVPDKPTVMNELARSCSGCWSIGTP